MTSGAPPARAGRLGIPGAVAAVLMVAAAIALAVSSAGVLGALRVPSADAASSALATEREAEEHARNLDAMRAQFDGRSLLFVPGPPPPPPPPPPTVVERTEPPPPPPPSSYGGPKLIGMVNGVAWFEDGTRLAAGEEKGGLRVVSLDPPWDASVEWNGVRFTVSLFARDSVILKEPSRPQPEQSGAPPAREKAADPPP